jgi:hypothetical protein
MYDTKNQWLRTNQTWIEGVERQMLEESLRGSSPNLPLKIITKLLKEGCHEIFRLQRLCETLETTIKTTRDSQPKPEVKVEAKPSGA